MNRLESTKNIFRNQLQTTINLLETTDRQITQGYHKLNITRGAIIRTKNIRTLSAQLIRLTPLLAEFGHNAPRQANKNKMLNSIKWCIDKNSYLRYAAINQSVINLCIVYEDFIRRIITKYYEEDIRRLASEKETFKNKQLIEAILRGDNIHHSLAEKTVDSIMYGSLDKWIEELKKIGISIQNSKLLSEIFLIRNCIVHNNRRRSTYLHMSSPSKYKLRYRLNISIEDVKIYKDIIHKSATYIASEYDRLFPKVKGTWVKNIE